MTPPTRAFATPHLKPRIPAHFHRKSLTGAAALVVFMLLMFLGPAVLNHHLLLQSEGPLWLRIVLSIPLFVIAGQGVHLMGWIGHDGFHFTFHENRHVSALIGLLFSSMTLFFFQSGMAMDHWSHHRFANTHKDPDLRLLRRYRTLLGRMLAQRNRANAHYFRRTLGLALGRPLPPELEHIRLPFPLAQFRVLAWLNIAFVLGWLLVYLCIEARWPGFLWIGVAIPLVVGGWLSGLRSFTEHAHTAEGDLHDTRSRTHPLFTIMEFGGNHHLEHHLYPAVPQWRLPALHRWLVAQGHYDALPDRSLIDPRLSVYRYALGRYPYGGRRAATRGAP